MRCPSCVDRLRDCGQSLVSLHGFGGDAHANIRGRYRSGDAITLEPVSFEYLGSEFLQDDGSNLSDHNPVHVDFTWSAA